MAEKPPAPGWPPGYQATDATLRRVAIALESIAESLAKISNPQPVDVAAQFREAMEAVRREMPVFAFALDRVNDQLRIAEAGKGPSDVA